MISLRKHWKNISLTFKFVEGVGAILAVVVAILTIYSLVLTDRTEHFNNLFYQQYLPIISRLDLNIIEQNIEIIKKLKNPKEYGEFLAKEIPKRSADGEIENAIRLLDSLVVCYEGFFCRIDQFDENYSLKIRQFWYAYGPYIKLQRGTSYEPTYGRKIEELAIEIWDKERN